MIQKFFSFQGRLNRKPYWLRVLALVAICFVGAFALAFLGAAAGLGAMSAILAVPLWLAAILGSFSLGARRLHDRNKSGWWLLLYYGLPMVLGGVATYMSLPSDLATLADPNNPKPVVPTNPIAMILQLVGAVISIWALIDIGFLKGTSGDNDYGPDPLANTGNA